MESRFVENGVNYRERENEEVTVIVLEREKDLMTRLYPHLSQVRHVLLVWYKNYLFSDVFLIPSPNLPRAPSTLEHVLGYLIGDLIEVSTIFSNPKSRFFFILFLYQVSETAYFN